MERNVKLIVIAGPTASGKTDIGIELAQALDGEIISVDSMQIYRWMDIGTAKPSPDLLSKVPHHLIDILDPDEPYNAGKFCQDADHVISTLSEKQKSIILVGGTNLYIRALINGIIPIPEVSPDTKSYVRILGESEGVETCYERLKEVDPESAKVLHPNDISRISRALEVALETGESIQKLQNNHRFKDDRYEVRYFYADWPRDEIYDRINRRVHIMVEQGLIDETASLMKRGYDDSLPSMNSIGYKQAVSHLKGDISLDEMIADIQQKSRRYAKKQLTWFRKGYQVHRLDRNSLTERDIELAKAFLDQ